LLIVKGVFLTRQGVVAARQSAGDGPRSSRAFKRKAAVPAAVLLWVLAGFVTPGQAQIPWVTEGIERAPSAEVYGIGQYLHSDPITFKGPLGDVRLDMDDTGLGGFGLGYHFNTFVSVRAEFMFGGAGFRVRAPTGVGEVLDVKQDGFIHTGRLNLDYNIINRRLTPFVTAGIGYQYLEMELGYLPPIEVCWWDPWWGWVCGYAQPYASQTDFTWNAGAGVRWDVTDSFFLKLLGGANWLQFGGAEGITTQIEAVFSVGWRF
jgi:opacity protein-like surface antigen